MKSSIFHFFLLLIGCHLTSTLLAQEALYLPTAVEGANWIILNTETPLYPYYAFVQSIDGDTVVNEVAYKKLYEHTIDFVVTEEGPSLTSPYTVFPERRLRALLRDDTLQRQVFGMVSTTFLDSGFFTPDTLLHDYSLEVGDTLRGINFETEIGAFAVAEVRRDIHFGEERRVQLSDGGVFYEGVGSSMYGPLSGGTIFFTACCIIGMRDYCMGDLSDCNVFLSPVTELSQNTSIKSFPNPFTSQLNFTPMDYPTGKAITVSLRDLSGRLLRKGTLGAGLQWPTEDFVAGVYLATFTSGVQSNTVKLVKW